MTYILSYVNMPNGYTVNYDREFETVNKLIEFVKDNHRNATSYQIIVLCK